MLRTVSEGEGVGLRSLSGLCWDSSLLIMKRELSHCTSVCFLVSHKETTWIPIVTLLSVMPCHLEC